MTLAINSPMIQQAARWLRALGEENRIRLLLRLQEGPANVTTLAADLGLSHASASKHLNVLAAHGIVEARREGPAHVYAIADRSVFEICDIVCAGVRRHHERLGEALAQEEES